MLSALWILIGIPERADRIDQHPAFLVHVILSDDVHHDLFEGRLLLWSLAVAIGLSAAILAGYFLYRKKEGWAFAMTGLLILVPVATFFTSLFPRVMISSFGSAYDLTVSNAASSPYTLKAMTIVAVALLPFVLAYQAWSYYVFRKRVSARDHLEY